jgi:glycosyltransferase involved in cell wall biosynthesis
MVDAVPSLLILSGVKGDPRRYRTFHLYEQARLAGLSCQLSHVTDPGLHQKASRASVIILHRAAYDAQVAWIEKEIHDRHGLLVADLDDLIFDPEAVRYIHSPDFSDPVRRSLYIEDVRRFRHTLELCDHVIVSSNFLAERIRQLGKPASIHRNAFSLEMQAISENALATWKTVPGRKVIGYASGTPTHDQDFALIQPVLKSTLARYPEAELWLVGKVDPGSGWGETGGRVKKLPLVPWRKLPQIQAQFDINLAPLLVDNPFGQSKSEIKYVEAALLKVLTIASPSEAYAYAIQDGETGLLARYDQEWQDKLEQLIGNPTQREELSQAARQDVLERYHPLVRARQLVENLKSITGLPFEPVFEDQSASLDDSPGRYWSCAAYEKSPTTIQRGVYTLRYRSLRTLVQQVWIYFRRLVSPVFPFPNPR